MCRECMQTPCHPSCPNAPEPVVIHECAWCSTEIVEGDEYFDINQDIICADCIEGCRKTAELEDEPDHDEADRYE